MKPILVACLALLPVSAAAQADPGHGLSERPESPQRHAAPPGAPREAPAGSPPPALARPAQGSARAAASGQDALWSWFIGTKDRPGAYKAPALCCDRVHDLVNANKDTARRSRAVTFEGFVFHYNVLLSIASNPKLCAAGPATPPGRSSAGPAVRDCEGKRDGVLAEAVLASPPPETLAWLRSADASAQAELSAYLEALDSPKAKDALVVRRERFFNDALKLAFGDPGFRATVCGRLKVPDCGSLSVDALYEAGRKAL